MREVFSPARRRPRRWPFRLRLSSRSSWRTTSSRSSSASGWPRRSSWTRRSSGCCWCLGHAAHGSRQLVAPGWLGRLLPGGASPMRRLGPPPRKLTLTVHVVAGVGWLGVHAVLILLAATGLTTGDRTLSRGLRHGRQVVWLVFPFAGISLVSGLVLSLGTAWGLFRHCWVHREAGHQRRDARGERRGAEPVRGGGRRPRPRRGRGRGPGPADPGGLVAPGSCCCRRYGAVGLAPQITTPPPRLRRRTRRSREPGRAVQVEQRRQRVAPVEVGDAVVQEAPGAPPGPPAHASPPAGSSAPV